MTVIKVGCSVGGLPKTETSKDSGLVEFQKAWRYVGNITVCVWILTRGQIHTAPTKGDWEVHSFREADTPFICGSSVLNFSYE